VAGSRTLKLRRSDSCAVCGDPLAAGTTAYWDAEAKAVTCLACHSRVAPTQNEVLRRAEVEEVMPAAAASAEAEAVPVRWELDRGVPGASARRRYEKLHRQREERVRGKLGKRLGGFYLALSEEPQSTVAWARGARGERLLGEALEKLHEETVIVLHDRRIPGSRANIDHIAVTRSGAIWAIDAKNYTGKVQRIDKGGWFSTDYRLYVGKRDCTKLVGAMAKQKEALHRAIGEPVRQEFGVQVKAALCFVDAEWSLFAKPFALEGVWIGWGNALRERLCADGELAPEHLAMLAKRVAETLPAA
jgi:hypothetical protein